ncbi:MAG: hypothetical protein HYY84_02875 [Deltaproteobacteria bacterium]|nr:hypothetical protein [Deltaproteobacteria bacterium]
MKRSGKLAVVLGGMMAVGAVSCKKEAPPPPPARRDTPPPTPPPPVKKDEPPKAAPKWAAALPAKAVAAKVGDMVWATIPQDGSEMARFGLYKVDAVAGNTATLKDGIGSLYKDVPGAAIHAAGDGSKLKVGDAANGYAWAASKVVGLVTKVEAGKVTLKYNWGSKPSEKLMDHAEPLRAGVTPIAWVIYESSFGPYKGLLVALEGDKGWIHTDSGHVEMHDKTKLKGVELKPGYKEGATVQAYGWGQGFKAGTIAHVAEPNLWYKVKLAGQDQPKDFFFNDLAEKL